MTKAKKEIKNEAQNIKESAAASKEDIAQNNILTLISNAEIIIRSSKTRAGDITDGQVADVIIGLRDFRMILSKKNDSIKTEIIEKVIKENESNIKK